MRGLAAQISLTIVCILFGALLMIQFRTQGTIAKSIVTESSANQAQIIANLYDSNVNLRKEVESLQQQHEKYQQSLSAGGLGNLVSELNKYRAINGLAEVQGTGVELKIVADIRSEDVQDLINEFRNAGAEALTINNQRIAVRSSVRADRGGVAVNNVRLDSPYVFQAIGAPEILDRALTRKGGLLSYLSNTYPNAAITVEKRTQLVLPVYAQGFPWRFAQPVR